MATAQASVIVKYFPGFRGFPCISDTLQVAVSLTTFSVGVGATGQGQYEYPIGSWQ
jgi:hypothetical protein